MSDLEFARWKREQIRILIEMDVAAFRKAVPAGDAAQEDVIRMAMHKARCELHGAPHHLRMESQAWLLERGCTAGINPVSPKDTLA